MNFQEAPVADEVLAAAESSTTTLPTETTDGKSYEELKATIEDMKRDDFPFPELGSEEQLLHYLATDSPIKTEFMERARSAEIPDPAALAAKIGQHFELNSFGAGEDGAEETAAARQQAEEYVGRISAYLTQGKAAHDEFGLTSRDHELRKDWRRIMANHYSPLFQQAYETVDQFRNGNMTRVTTNTENLVDTLTWTDVSDEASFALQDLATESEDLTEKAAGTPPSREARLELVRDHEDLAIKVLTALKEHFDPDNEVPTKKIEIT